MCCRSSTSDSLAAKLLARKVQPEQIGPERVQRYSRIQGAAARDDAENRRSAATELLPPAQARELRQACRRFDAPSAFSFRCVPPVRAYLWIAGCP